MKVVYNKELNKLSNEKKLKNIQAFSSLDREGLSFESTQRRLLIKEFSTGEKLFIQYPGKESARKESPRPWDFRPKVLKSNGEWLEDLTFKNIWDDLFDLKNRNIDMSKIAVLYFRMAYMLDSVEITKELTYEDIDANEKIVNTGKLTFTWYDYNIDESLLNSLNIPSNILRDISFLVYLNCNDLLAQNEDCKYFYRSEEEKQETWNYKTGRTNTLLTHMAVIAFIEEQISFTEIMDGFQRGRGVAPLSSKYWEVTTNGVVKK